jgi:ubiquinone/menaquinone biosynthesis C-methylase UbiE
MVTLVCNECRSILFKESEYYICIECGRKINIERGIVTYSEHNNKFNHNSAFEIPLSNFMSNFDKKGWAIGFYELQKQIKSNSSDLFDSVLRWDRTGWKYLLPITKESTVLDFNFGWGGISLSLSCNVKEVISLGPRKEQLIFARYASRFLDRNNISFIHYCNYKTLPFSDDTFDIIVISDLGLIDENNFESCAKKRDVLLKEINRILKPQGILYISAKNILSYAFLKSKFLHMEYKLNPFKLDLNFNGYARKKRSKRHEGYVCSLYGLKKTVRKAGFQSFQSLSIVPDKERPAELIDLSTRCSKNRTNNKGTSLSKRLKNGYRFLSIFGPNFSITASKSSIQHISYMNALVDKIKESLKIDELKIDKYIIRPALLLVFCNDLNENRVIIRIPYSEREAFKVKNNTEVLKKLTDKIVMDNVRFPELLLDGYFCDNYYSVETCVQGESADRLKIKNHSEFIDVILNFIINFGLNMSSKPQQSGSQLISYFEEIIAFIKSKLIENGLKDAYGSLTDLYLNKLNESELRPITIHGDLNLGNCLFLSNNMKYLGVIDWDQSIDYGLPGWDLINMMNFMRRKSSNKYWGESLLSMLDFKWAETEFGLWNKYTNYYDITQKHLDILILSIWLKGLSYIIKSHQKQLDPNWIKQNVTIVLSAFKAGFFKELK